VSLCTPWKRKETEYYQEQLLRGVFCQAGSSILYLVVLAIITLLQQHKILKYQSYGNNHKQAARKFSMAAQSYHQAKARIMR
jgi:hypothetical protein